MKYEVKLCGIDRAMADKLYKMGMEAGVEVKVEQYKEEEGYKEEPKRKGPRGVMAAVTERDE